jgi:hypothetical protein
MKFNIVLKQEDILLKFQKILYQFIEKNNFEVKESKNFDSFNILEYIQILR